MSTELARVLRQLAQDYAPHLVDNSPRPDPAILARRLANDAVLVVIGQPDARYASDPQNVARLCAGHYMTLYRVLVDALFPPALRQIQALYQVYDQSRLLVCFKAEAGPVTQALAGYVAPYVAERQAAKSVSDYEVLALMEVVLHTLDADDLAQAEWDKLKAQGAVLVKRMLGMPLRQLPLTAFDTPFFSKIEPEPPPQPPDLPEVTHHTGPFSTTLTPEDDEELSFLRDLAAPQEPVEKLPPLRDQEEHTPDTGQQSSIRRKPTQAKQGQPREKKGGQNSKLRSPLPYWDDGGES